MLKYGVALGLQDPLRLKRLEEKEEAIQSLSETLRRIKPDPEEVNILLTDAGTTPLVERQSLYHLLKRPQVTLLHLSKLAVVEEVLEAFGDLQEEVCEQVEIEVKYEGYFERQEEQVRRFLKLESKAIPDHFDFTAIESLSTEAREKLMQFRPASLGQAARISGVSPSDIAVLAVVLEKASRKGNVSRGTSGS